MDQEVVLYYGIIRITHGKINGAIFPGTQGGPLMNSIAAKAQAFTEANTPEFKEYAKEVVKSAKALAQSFVDNGYSVATKGTDSHIVLVDLSDKNMSGREAADLLEKNGITVNKNGVPNDPRSFKGNQWHKTRHSSRGY